MYARQIKPLAYIVVFIFLMLLTLHTIAQSTETCDDLVETALTIADETCFTIGRNELCYANTLVSALDLDGVTINDFSTPGDIVPMANIQHIQTASLNTTDDIWGIVLMRLQANVEGTVPGQAVTFLIFGDAEFEQTDVTDAGIRGFILKSGIGSSECGDLPSGGLLFQSPEGTKELELSLNNINISAGSTLFVRLEQDNQLQIAVIEGQAEVMTNGIVRQLGTESQVMIPVDEDGMANGDPSDVEAFDPSILNALLALLPGDPTLVYCPVGQANLIASPGTVYFAPSDGPHFPNINDVFSYEVALDGVSLPIVTDVFFVDERYEQWFDAGVLREGDYTVSYTGRVNREITDPLGQTWGPTEWSWSCTLTVEAE